MVLSMGFLGPPLESTTNQEAYGNGSVLAQAPGGGKPGLPRNPQGTPLSSPTPGGGRPSLVVLGSQSHCSYPTCRHLAFPPSWAWLCPGYPVLTRTPVVLGEVPSS